ncbi:asparaginase [Actinopolymorpha sp. B9G3]|uniref:asparaginase n=1 Tax=Actinopolymorpha sp. B9G3 TaxID=3158970 RepID=UPI0032D902C1
MSAPHGTEPAEPADTGPADTGPADTGPVDTGPAGTGAGGASPVVAEVVRSGFVECRHRGSVVALAADGSVEFAVGDVTGPCYPRSANKPMQATAMLRAGLDLDGELLALATASHSGEAFHADGVRRILRGVGLTEAALRCPPSWPIDTEALHARIAGGERPDRATMNCSGKHAGMLAACVSAGWPVETYLDPAHPLQVMIRETVEDLAAEKVAHTGVDGCGAPLFALSLTGLARAFRTMVLAPPDTPEGRVVAAVRAHPRWTSGTARDESALIAAVPGIFAKSGAEGCYAAALDDGRAVTLKIDDGSQRARPVVMAAALRRLGVSGSVIDEQLTAEVRGGGMAVGEIRSVGI